MPFLRMISSATESSRRVCDASEFRLSEQLIVTALRSEKSVVFSAQSLACLGERDMSRVSLSMMGRHFTGLSFDWLTAQHKLSDWSSGFMMTPSILDPSLICGEV